MRKIVHYCCLLPLLLGWGLFAFAKDDPKPQDVPKPEETSKVQTAPAHYYHVDFVVQELGPDGKAVNSRSYATTVNTGSSHEAISVRASSRIPVKTGENQWQYSDVGINIDARDAHEIGRQLALNLTAEVRSMATTDQSMHEPVVRQIKWQAAVLIPVGKPTVVFTSDALESKGSMQLMVTATPLQ